VTAVDARGRLAAASPGRKLAPWGGQQQPRAIMLLSKEGRELGSFGLGDRTELETALAELR
jgi:hypothetical protein